MKDQEQDKLIEVVPPPPRKEKFLKKLFRLLFLSKQEIKYINHNKKLFNSNKSVSENIVLIELNGAASNVIAYSYLSNILKDIHDAKLVGYIPNIPSTFFKKILWSYKFFFGFYATKLFKSFGVESFVIPTLTKKLVKKANLIFEESLPKIVTKVDLENFSINGVVFGDLIYDSYLDFFTKATVDIGSSDFNSHLKNCIQCIVFWQNFFENNEVKGLNTSHTVYLNAIPSRIAALKNLDCFQTNATHLYRLSEANPFAYTQFKEFKSIFSSLTPAEQSVGIQAAKERIEQRFAGKVGVDMDYSKKSAFGEIKDERLLEKSDRIKILIAPHCFFDNPHPFGNNLFPDVFDWLEKLVEISEKTNYDWYVKTHPDFIPESRQLIEEYIAEIPNFNLLPPDASHHQIVKEGVDFALTMYGTIGFEYAAMNIPVINASLNNPHIAFDFNIHPKSKEEYVDLLMNLNSVEHEINVDDVYKYYFMDKLYFSGSWIFRDYIEVLAKLGGYHGQFTSEMYTYWLNNWSEELHESILIEVKKFVKSNEYLLITTGNLNQESYDHEMRFG
jgi:hypothetical protein